MIVKELTIVSGKGGSGKTTIAASLAALANNPVIVDADVDAADMHLLLQPTIQQKESFTGLDVAQKDDDKCNMCGKCYDSCRYGAFDTDLVLHPDKCEGCAVCTIVCPVDAIKMVERVSGEAYISSTRYGPLVHARLCTGGEASGKLVTLVRQRAKEVAEKLGRELILTDGPPGIGCAVIASITGADYVLVIIEPTLSGIHDAKRMMGVAKHFGIPVLACINKYDINENNTEQIINYCLSEDVRLVGKIPYDDIATKAMMAGKTVVEFSKGDFSQRLRDIWTQVKEALS